MGFNLPLVEFLVFLVVAINVLLSFLSCSHLLLMCQPLQLKSGQQICRIQSKIIMTIIIVVITIIIIIIMIIYIAPFSLLKEKT